MSGRKRKHHEEEHVNHERWLVSYADFITLLFVLFVVMYSLGKADVAKYAKLQASLQRAFRVEVLQGNDPTSVRGNDGTLMPTAMIREGVAQLAAYPDSRLVTTIDELREAMTEVPRPEAGRGNVEIGAARDGAVISLSGNVLFDSGRADLKPEGLVLLDAVAERLTEMSNEIRVEGHTDDTPIATQLYPSNWELSSARATTVARYLSEHGVAPLRLAAAGYGEYRPAAPNETREGRARNRRVDIVIISPGTAAAAPAAAPSTNEAHPSHPGVHP